MTQDNTTEEWRPVVGYEGLYEVSSLGRVARCSYGRRRIKSAWPNDKGYLRLKLCRDAKQRTVSLHQLVARAFVAGYRPGLEVNHRDLDKSHNAATNLEWVTDAGNRAHRSMMRPPKPTILRGRVGHILHPTATVQAIRAIGRSQPSRTIARRFGLSKSQVNRILSGENRARAT